MISPLVPHNPQTNPPSPPLGLSAFTLFLMMSHTGGKVCLLRHILSPLHNLSPATNCIYVGGTFRRLHAQFDAWRQNVPRWHIRFWGDKMCRVALHFFFIQCPTRYNTTGSGLGTEDHNYSTDKIMTTYLYTYEGQGRVLIVGHMYLFILFYLFFYLFIYFLFFYGLTLLLSRGVLGLSLTVRFFFLRYC